MKIETIEQAIAAIEDAGYTIRKTVVEAGFLWWKSKTTYYDMIMPVTIYGNNTVGAIPMDETKLFEFARKCQLKAFW